MIRVLIRTAHMDDFVLKRFEYIPEVGQTIYYPEAVPVTLPVRSLTQYIEKRTYKVASIHWEEVEGTFLPHILLVASLSP